MKRIVCVLAIFLILPVVRAQESSELRAVWLTNVDSNVLFSDQNIVDAMDYLASIGVNVVFPVVYNKGYTLYPSSIMDLLFGAPVLPGSPFVNRDFLDRMVIEAHRNGIEVIPWFEFGFSTSYSLNGGHIIAKYPSWALKDVNGKLIVDNGFDWMSAINPDAQRFMSSLMMEVLDRYNVEGVQGDDRLPAMPVEGGYDSVTAQIYAAENGGQPPPSDNFNTAWMRWRANKLTQYLGRLRDSVKARGQNIILSMAPTPYYWGYRELLQDSKSWAQQGLADNLIPQLYQYNISDFTYALNTTWNDVGQYNPGIFCSGLLARVGAYVVDTTFLGQMMTASRAKGAKGESLFFYEGLRANNDLVGKYLGRNFYRTPAVPPYRGGKRWIPKGLIVNETDSGAMKTGTWSSYPMKGFQGAIQRTEDTVHAAAFSYAFTIENAAYYDVFAFFTPNTIWTQRAVYTIRGDGDSSRVIVDQTDLNRKGWQKIGTVFLPAGTSTVLSIDNSNLEPGKYLVADAAMLMLNRRRSPGVVLDYGEDREADRPAEFGVLENYPNPFNPTTVVSCQLPVASWIKLDVYDTLGREVASLANERKAAGRFDVRWDASGYPSGMYICRLTAGQFTSSRKMLLMK